MDKVNGIPALADTDPAALIGQYSRDLRDYLIGSGEWFSLALDPAWSHVSNYEARVCRIGPIVYFSGLIALNSGDIPANQKLNPGSVPPGFTGPSRGSQWFTVGTTQGCPPATMVVSNAGNLELRTPNVSVPYVGLASIQYPTII